MFGLFQNTPPYAGDGQPTSNSSQGAFGLLSGSFGFPVTPTYAAAETSSVTGAGGILAPAPDPQACEQVTAQPACSVPLPVAIVIQRSE